MKVLAALFRHRPLVLLVCTANVCRSPLAAAALRAELAARGQSRRYRVRSAGTRVGAPGRLPDPRMKKMAAARGLSLRGERAQALSSAQARKARLIIVMEERHRSEVLTLLGDAAAVPEVRLLSDWLEGHASADSDIPDPYFANAQALEMVFDQICAACRRLAADIARTEPFFFDIS